MSQSVLESATPTTVFGFEVLARIGEGQGSIIYAVSDPDTRQVYALKHVIRSADCQTRVLEQLNNEYQIGRAISHPCLRKCLYLKERRTLLLKVIEAALVMEMVDAVTLETIDYDRVDAIIDCGIATAHALEAMHTLGLVHCDLKPNNILIRPDGSVKIIDFGQTCRCGTVKERIQGTPDYIAPEQVRCRPVTPLTDIFNFGATFYRALCGQCIPTLYTLKKGDNSFLMHDRIPAPAELNRAVPGPLSHLIMECVRLKPEDRPPTMGELAYRLEAVKHGMKSARAAN